MLAWSRFFCAILACVTICRCQGIDFVPLNHENTYEFEGTVNVIAQAPWDQINSHPQQTAAWKIRGTTKLQRTHNNTLAASLAVEKITVNKHNGSPAVFYQNKEMQTLYSPFKIVYVNDTIDYVQFKATDALWSKNFKRAIASAFQLKSLKHGAFVEQEPGIHGTCSVEYYVTTKSNGHLLIRKNPVLSTCNPNTCGIHSHRSNLPETKCFEGESDKNVIVGNEAVYDLVPRDDKQSNESKDFDGYDLRRIYVEGNTMLQTFESTGESQLVVSKLTITFMESNEIVTSIDVHTNMASQKCNLTVDEHSISDVTGERQTFETNELVHHAVALLGELADSLENGHIEFGEPYEHRIVEVIRYFSRCNFQSLKSLYESINVGTSYRQETMRNLFFDIIPRTGTRASVLLTRDLITENLCKPTTAVQLLIALPFHITELSADIVSDCEPLMRLSIDRPDIQQIGILSFATIVHRVFVAGKLDESSFDKYVKAYFHLFSESDDYEYQLLYLQALSNLKLGKVTHYLDPIIRDESQSNDVRFMATWIKESVAEQSTFTEKRTNFETFWPIFENRSAPIELRVAAFMTLLTTDPTSARLMSIHTLMETETNPHLINFYRTTLLSLAGTTQSCYQKLSRLAASMIRHLPKAPAKRYWVTGNYIFDYRSNEYGLGSSLQTLLIGNGRTQLPQIAFFKMRQEAMGKYTNELTLYVKARGLDNVRFGRIVQMENGASINLSELRTILSSLKMPTVVRSPIHLEIVVQMEGKTVLVFFLNQQSFNTLVEGDIINRIMKLLQMDSMHINLQNLRWPFLSRYSVPTVLGTPTSLTVQSTVLSSLRGNISQKMEGIGVSRSHEIDLRYSSFTVVSSKSYNPFLNSEHSINREQGFLIYLPINSDVKLNLLKSSLWFSFFRPENLISGISLKSRIRTITRGRPLRASEPFIDIAVYEGDPSLVPSKLINYEIEDLGLVITGISHPFDIMSHMKLMFHMEPSINTFVYHEMEPLMKLWSVIRVNDIHIGTNKKFTLLFHNTKNIKLEGKIAIVSNPSTDVMDTIERHTVDLTFEHKCDEKPIHKLSAVLRVQDDKAVSRHRKSDQLKMQLVVIHTNKNQQQWMLHGDATYEPVVFLKQPYLLQGSVSFGNKNGSTSITIENPTKITFEAFANILNNALNTYENLTDTPHCPRQVLKFSPPPQNEDCDQTVYEGLTALHNFGLNVTFHNNPKWLKDTLTRLDYLMTALSTHTDLYEFTNKIDAQITTFSDKLQLSASVNGKNVTVPNLPLCFNQHFDAKFDRPEQLVFSIGRAHMCTLISSNVNTFDDRSVKLESNRQSNCSVLLVADCSIKSRFALFATPIEGELNQTSFVLELHIDDHVIWYTPRKDGIDFIRLKDSSEIEVTTLVMPLGEDIELSVYVNAENLLIFELLKKIQIQYYRGEVLTIQIPSSIKANLCGLCSLPFNVASDYHYCH